MVPVGISRSTIASRVPPSLPTHQYLLQSHSDWYSPPNPKHLQSPKFPFPSPSFSDSYRIQPFWLQTRSFSLVLLDSAPGPLFIVRLSSLLFLLSSLPGSFPPPLSSHDLVQSKPYQMPLARHSLTLPQTFSSPTPRSGHSLIFIH